MAIHIENITPILMIKDMTASLKFYVDILGFRNADWGDDNFTSVNRDRPSMYLCKDSQGNRGTWIWMSFDGDIFAFYEELKTKGVTIKLQPANYSWALEMQVEDPGGHILRFGTDPDYNQPFLDKQL